MRSNKLNWCESFDFQTVKEMNLVCADYESKNYKILDWHNLYFNASLYFIYVESMHNHFVSVFRWSKVFWK